MTVTNYLWDDDGYLEEYDDAGATTTAYTNEPIEFGSVVSQRRNAETNFYHYDAQGSTHQLTDQNENVTDTYLYGAWGNIVSSTGTTVNPFRWIGNVGYYWDEETESNYVRARVYQPVIGRWLSTDPLGFIDGLNLFLAYFVPNKIDPSGLVEATFSPEKNESHPWTRFAIDPFGLGALGYTNAIKKEVFCECHECYCHEFEIKCTVNLAFHIYVRINPYATAKTHYVDDRVYSHEQRHVESHRGFYNKYLVPIMEAYEHECLSPLDDLQELFDVKNLDETKCKQIADAGTRHGRRLLELHLMGERGVPHRSDFWSGKTLAEQYNFPVLGTMPPPS